MWSYTVLAVDQHDDGIVTGDLCLVISRIRADDQQVTDAAQPRRRAIQRDLPRAAWRADRVGRETRAVGDVVDLDVLVGKDARSFEQRFVDTTRAFVVEDGLGEGHAVK